MKIFIDAGHNFSGGDTGAQGNGLREQDITFMIADKLKKLFINGGHNVKMSRNSLSENIGGTVSESINRRASMSNEWDAELFISIHCNASGGKGTETLVYSKGGSAFNYAQKIQKNIVQNLKTVDRGVKVRTDLGVLKLTNCPAILIETAFIDNANDSVLLKDRQNEFARSIYEAVTGDSSESKKNNTELIDINDIVWELAERKIITDKNLWLEKLGEDINSYWLARKALNYIRSNEI